MPGHAHIFPDAARSRTIANGAVPPVCLGTVRCTLSMHVVFLHLPLESFAFIAAVHINEVARLKLCDVQVHFSIRQIGLQSKLSGKSFWFDAGLLERAQLRIVLSRFLLLSEPDSPGRVPVC